MKQYQSKKWKAFRQEMIAMNEGRCAHCEKSASGGAILQIHHIDYDKTRPIWDYQPDEVQVLCKGCHAETHGKIRPKSGWECVAEDDLGELSGECELCGTAIRYVFLIEHPNWSPMEVGTDCCDKLTGDHAASDRRKYLDKRIKFCSSSRWQVGRGRYFISQSGVDAIILNRSGIYKIIIDGAEGKDEFRDLNLAKCSLYDKITSGEIQKWLIKRSKK